MRSRIKSDLNTNAGSVNLICLMSTPGLTLFTLAKYMKHKKSPLFISEMSSLYLVVLF